MPEELRDAINCFITNPTVSIFALGERGLDQELEFCTPTVTPREIRRYMLEWPQDWVGEAPNTFAVAEHDVVFDELPSELDAYLRSCLAETLAVGNVVAWLGFEGSFSFEHLLTPGIAGSIYGVAHSGSVAVAERLAELETNAWSETIETARSHLPWNDGDNKDTEPAMIE